MSPPAADAREPTPSPEEQPRVLGPLAAFGLVAGSMIGIGIFIYPPLVAKNLGDPALVLAIWGFGGLVALAGASAYAELGTLLPRAGGDYVFQRAAFGPDVASATGWVMFGAAFTGSIAVMAVALSKYQVAALLGLETGFEGHRTVAAAVVLAITVVNALGARLAGSVQVLLTLLAFLPLLGLAAIALSDGPDASGASALTAPVSPTASGVVASFLAVYFAYAGWNGVVYASGEVKEPSRSLPVALLGGTGSVTALYLLLVGAFLTVLGPTGLAEAGEAGSALAGRVGGEALRDAVVLLIALAMVASINATVLGGARVAWAMSRDGALPRALSPLDRRGVPARALWVQAAVASVWIATGTFEDVTSMTSVAMVAVGSATVLSLYVLRARDGGRSRTFHAVGYPWLPAVYVLASAAAVGVMAWNALSGEVYPLAGLALLLVVYIARRLSRRRSRARAA